MCWADSLVNGIEVRVKGGGRERRLRRIFWLKEARRAEDGRVRSRSEVQEWAKGSVCQPSDGGNGSPNLGSR